MCCKTWCKKGNLLTKLIVETKNQERGFVISVEGMPDNFKGTHPSARSGTDHNNSMLSKIIQF